MRLRSPARLPDLLWGFAFIVSIWWVNSPAAAAPDPSDGRVSSFYSWDKALPPRPGVMLRNEPVPAPLSLDEASIADRILYSATDGVDGRSISAVSGEVFLPKGQRPESGWPVVAWAHGTVGVADICAPSWAARSYRDIEYLNTWLRAGYAVVASDYEGLGTPGPHPYLNSRSEAYSVIDGVRAALSGRYGLSNRVVVVGQSQGAGAALAAAGYGPVYAPDVKLLGVVATGVPNLSLAGLAGSRPQDPNKVDKKISLFFYLALVAQQHHASYTAQDFFTPLAAPLFERARVTCHPQLETDTLLLGLTLSNAIKTGPMASGLALIVPSLAYPTMHFSVPIFVGTGEDDEEIPAKQQKALVTQACAAGSIVEAHLYPGQNHSSTVNASVKDSLPFVARLLAHESISSSCGTPPSP